MTDSTAFGAKSATSNVFGQSTFGVSTANTGTTLKFKPLTGIDTMEKGGVSTSVGTRHQYITCMEEYKNKSLEELRVEDYAANRKGGTTGGIIQGSTAFSAKSAASNVFGQSPFGVSTPNTESQFLNTSQPIGSGLFKQTSLTTFGAPASTSTGTFAFGDKPDIKNVFVLPPFGVSTPNIGSQNLNTSQPTGSGLFGQTSSTSFGAPASTSAGTFAFGKRPAASKGFVLPPFGLSTPNTGSRILNTSQPTGSGLFGQTSSTSFGAPASTSIGTFGNKFVSCAIQTDISAIDTKDPKDQDLPFLQTKDVTLLTKNMKELLIKGSDHDVKITVKDKQFQAHRIILRTRSPVFAMMLTHDSKESITGTINIKDCDPDSFDEFLLYLYSGRTENLTPTKALHLYYTADKYDIPALKERCVIFLKTSLSVDSICDVVLLATKHDEKELLKEATKFFAQNMKKILVTVHWQKFLSENPIEGNELYIKSMEFFVLRK